MEYSPFLFIHLFHIHFQNEIGNLTVDDLHQIVSEWYDKSAETNASFDGSEYVFVDQFLRQNKNNIEQHIKKVNNVDYEDVNDVI